MDLGDWTTKMMQDGIADRNSISGALSKLTAPNSWQRNYTVKAMNLLKLDSEKSKIKLKICLDRDFDAELIRELRGYKFYQRSLMGVVCSYVIESPAGVVYHDNDYHKLIKGLREKLSKMRTKMSKFSSYIPIDLRLCKQLGFSENELEEFCSKFNFDSTSTYYIHEIISKVQQNKQEASSYVAGLNVLFKSIGYSHHY